MAMRKYFRNRDRLTSFHVGLTVVAFAALVGLIALDANRGAVLPDQFSAEHPAAVAEAPSLAATAPTAYIVGKGSAARAPSVPADSDVKFAATGNEASAPTF